MCPELVEGPPEPRLRKASSGDGATLSLAAFLVVAASVSAAGYGPGNGAKASGEAALGQRHGIPL